MSDQQSVLEVLVSGVRPLFEIFKPEYMFGGGVAGFLFLLRFFVCHCSGGRRSFVRRLLLRRWFHFLFSRLRFRRLLLLASSMFLSSWIGGVLRGAAGKRRQPTCVFMFSSTLGQTTFKFKFRGHFSTRPQ
uniref:Transmembrane protein n=1 Tax=Physcomitrium patens TaxID=3218 RepID=A0A2K1J2Z1_PHYPA|nr:hypothetical protein PHYPA_021745 [Physcomitrium patens]